jgi:organic hydroperoxide reductase OsmC/OhrA
VAPVLQAGRRLAGFLHPGRPEEGAMAARFPHEYHTTLTWLGSGPTALGAGLRPVIIGGAPPQFGGEETRWSPEHLLLCSMNLSLQVTFDALARNAGLEVTSYRSRAGATLTLHEGSPELTYLCLDVTMVVGAGQEEQARDLLNRAKRHCLVADALRAPVHLRLEIRASAQPVAAAVH